MKVFDNEPDDSSSPVAIYAHQKEPPKSLVHICSNFLVTILIIAIVYPSYR